VFGDLARFILDKTSENPTMLRRLYFSALEGHPLSDLFYANHEIKKVMKLVDLHPSPHLRERIPRVGPLPGCQSFHRYALYPYVTAQHLFGVGRYYPKATHDEVIQNFLSIS
jgi:hypothetical protein